MKQIFLSRYHYLVLSLQEEDIELPVDISDEDIKVRKYISEPRKHSHPLLTWVLDIEIELALFSFLRAFEQS